MIIGAEIPCLSLESLDSPVKELETSSDSNTSSASITIVVSPRLTCTTTAATTVAGQLENARSPFFHIECLVPQVAKYLMSCFRYD